MNDKRREAMTQNLQNHNLFHVQFNKQMLNQFNSGPSPHTKLSFFLFSENMRQI